MRSTLNIGNLACEVSQTCSPVHRMSKESEDHFTRVAPCGFTVTPKSINKPKPYFSSEKSREITCEICKKYSKK